jgi:HlyD family secretion protein
MKVILYVCLLFTFLFLSCSGKKNDGVITFKLSKSDYIEKISVAGTVQAVVNFPVMPPSMMMGQMTIVRLSEDGSFVKKGDTICVLTVPELESMYHQILNSNDTLEADLKKTEADNRLNIALLEAQLATSEAQLKISSLDSSRMKFAPDVTRKLLELEMRQALIEKQKIEKKLAASKMIGESDIRQMNARIIGEKARTQSMADQVNSLTIIAQRDGIVMRTESPTFTFIGPHGIGKLGGPIREGSVLLFDSPVLQFPDLSRMQVSAEVLEADFKKIDKGQKVFITIDAAKKLVTTGKINRKSLMGHTAQNYSDSKVKFYEVIIDIDSCHSKMKPGLSADCEITLKEARDTLVVPTLAIFERDSTKVVYVRMKKKFIPVKVETGLSGSSHTIITGGLKGDEIIALSEPPNSLIATGKKNREEPKIVKKQIPK